MAAIPLNRALIGKISHYQARALVFRTRELHLPEMEAEVLAFARRFTDDASRRTKVPIRRANGRIIVSLPGGGRVIAFEASGALLGKRHLGPLEQPITKVHDALTFEQELKDAMRALGLDVLTDDRNRLSFERLWRIKAGSISLAGKRGQELLCRVVGAFRRELAGLPVWGRASVFVELGGTALITAAGRDWRACKDEPLEEVPIVDPNVGADRVLEELSTRVCRRTLTTDDYEPELFALGYFSFPVRRPQGYFQPVYVAKLNAAIRSTPKGVLGPNKIIVVPAASGVYEPIAPAIAAPPLSAEKAMPLAQH
jgi:hypothetical protein